jgi:DNA-binding transcriptional ArsR family regulator
MNVSVDLDPPVIRFPKPLTPSSGCDLECKERLFRTLADRASLRILDTLCKGAKTVEQIASATGQPEANVSIQLKRLVDCGCVKLVRIADSLYSLSPPGLLLLEAVADEFLEASFKGPEVSSYE